MITPYPRRVENPEITHGFLTSGLRVDRIPPFKNWHRVYVLTLQDAVGVHGTLLYIPHLTPVDLGVVCVPQTTKGS